mmetsp:Transcript_34969/g.55937  ORF Transcript_34969/g.55937 Transcript_34969/m.55937 type:complete len:365 (-) Transcript_34969:560-1654(-)
MPSIIIRNVSGDVKEIVDDMPAVVTLDMLEMHVQNLFGWESFKLVHQGQVLNDDDTVDVSQTCSTFVVVPKRSFATVSQRHAVSEEEINRATVGLTSRTDDISHQTQRPDHVERAPDQGDDYNNQPSCRICMSTENERSNRLFRPCKCRGTMQFAHVDCLNAWRRSSMNPHSNFKCEQCGYNYDIRRTQVAHVLDVLGSSPGSLAISLVALFLLVHILSVLVVEVGLRELFLNFVGLHGLRGANYSLDQLLARMSPEVEEFLDFYVCGLYIVGATGFGIKVFEIAMYYYSIRHHVNLVNMFWENPNVFIIGGSLGSHSKSSFCRLALGLGTAFYVAEITGKIQMWTKRTMHEIGEIIIEVTAES